MSDISKQAITAAQQINDRWRSVYQHTAYTPSVTECSRIIQDAINESHPPAESQREASSGKQENERSLEEKQLDAEQAWEFLQGKCVPNLDIEREGKDKVTLVELLSEFANGVYVGHDADSSPKQPSSAREWPSWIGHKLSCDCIECKPDGDFSVPILNAKQAFSNPIMRQAFELVTSHVTASLRADKETLRVAMDEIERRYEAIIKRDLQRAEAAERERDKETERANYNAEAAGANLLALKSAEAKLAKLWKALQIHGKHLQSCAKYKDRVYGETAYPSPDIECNCGLWAALQPQVELPAKGEKNG